MSFLKLKNKEEIRKVLIILYRRVGDSILALSLCHTLRQNFPEAEIDYVLDENIAPLYWNHPDIDNLILFSHKEKHSLLKYLRKVWKVTHAKHYDVIIDLRSTIQTLWFSLFSLGTPYRIGRKKSYNAFLQNYRLNITKNVDMVQQNLQLLSPLNKIKPIELHSSFRMYVSDEEKQSFRQYMAKQGVDFSKPVILVAVATRIVGKGWNTKRMAQVLSRIVEKYDAQLIFNFGNDYERRIAEAVKEDMGNDPRVFTTVEAHNLRELLQMVANCNFFFGNEGGPRHLAHALDVPSFAIFPPHIDKTTWLPQNDGHHQGISLDDVGAREKVTDNMSITEQFDLLTVDDVWTHADKMLSEYLRVH